MQLQEVQVQQSYNCGTTSRDAGEVQVQQWKRQERLQHDALWLHSSRSGSSIAGLH